MESNKYATHIINRAIKWQSFFSQAGGYAIYTSIFRYRKIYCTHIRLSTELKSDRWKLCCRVKNAWHLAWANPLFLTGTMLEQ